jgi:quercetin dioxygenase-like cupin family protein
MTPEVGLELVNPVAGTRMVFLATAASSNGEYVEIEATYPPNNAPPPRHLHPNQDERFELISGSLRGVRGDEEFAVSKGEELEVPRGTPHLMGAGDDGAVFRWRTSPALRTDQLFIALWQVAHDNDWAPNGMQLFNAISQFGDEFCLCS